MNALRHTKPVLTLAPSPAQYELQFKKWGFAKNLKSSEWAALISQYDLLCQTKTDVRITVSGLILSKNKIDRTRRRYRPRRNVVSEGESSNLLAALSQIAYFDAGCTLPASRQAHVEFLDESGEWHRYSGTQAKKSNALILRKSSHTALINDHLEHQDHLQVHETDPDPDPYVVHNGGAVGLVPSVYDYNPFNRPFSPSVNFDEFLNIPMSCFGSPSLAQTHTLGLGDSLPWSLSSGSGMNNGSLDFPPFLLESSVGSSTQAPGHEHQELVLGTAVSAPGNQSHLEGARSLIKSLVQHGKMTQGYKTDTSTNMEMPDVEDIMESLESLLPDTETKSREDSGLPLSVDNTSSSSKLFKTLMYSFTNNFAGLRDVPRKSLMQLLRERHDIRTQLFEVIKSGRPGVAKPLADNLFQAAVEGCDADAVATIIHLTKSNPKVAIDPNEVVCIHEGRQYTPIELAAKFRNTELVRTLVATSADPNKTYNKNTLRMWDDGALALALGHWKNGSSYPYVPSQPGEPEPVDIDLLRLLLDCGAKVRVDLAVNAMRPGPGHTVIAEELISRIPASDHRVCFEAEWLAISIIHYLENSAANRIIRRFFAHCSESTDCGVCVPESPRLIEMMLCHAARRSNLELSKFLIQHTTHLQSALAAAIRAVNDELVQFLLNRGARVDDAVESWHPRKMNDDDHSVIYYDLYDEDGYDRPTYSNAHIEYVVTPIRTPLAEAVRTRNDYLINTFERLGALNCLADEHHFRAAVLAAAELGNTSYLTLILDHASELPGESLTLALAVAIRNDETDAALMLVDAGANPYDSSCRYGDTLVRALERCNKRAVDSMLECELRLNRGFTRDGKSALEVAGSWCELEVIDDLIRLGADVDYGIQTTALAAAVRSRNRALVNRLLHLRANPEAQPVNADGSTALQAAVEIGDYDMIRFLISKGASPADTSAFAYAMDHDPVGYEFLLSEFKSHYPHGLGGFGGYLIGKAIELDSANLFDSLLEAGADVNSWCTIREPASTNHFDIRTHQRVLGLAIQHHKGRHHELVRRLLDRGADTDCIVIKHRHGASWILETPLLLAIKMKKPNLVTLLLERGADLNRPARRAVKRTPLQAACETGSHKMVDLLLQRGAHANDKAAERDGGTALQMAAKTGSLKIVKLLLDNGADPHMPKSKVRGITAFEMAASSGCIDILCLLWNAVLPFGFSEKECQSAKDFAKQRGHRGCVDFIDFLSGGSSQCFLNE